MTLKHHQHRFNCSIVNPPPSRNVIRRDVAQHLLPSHPSSVLSFSPSRCQHCSRLETLKCFAGEIYRMGFDAQLVQQALQQVMQAAVLMLWHAMC